MPLNKSQTVTEMSSNFLRNYILLHFKNINTFKNCAHAILVMGALLDISNSVFVYK